MLDNVVERRDRWHGGYVGQTYLAKEQKNIRFATSRIFARAEDEDIP